MAELRNIDTGSFKPKGFWQRPEGVTGAIFLFAVLGGAAWFFVTYSAAILAFLANTVGIVVSLLVLFAIIYMVLDPKMRTLVGYMYRSIMRWITGIFVTIDPIGILKNYIEDLEKNLRKMSQQIGGLRGQMRKLKTMVEDNTKEIEQSLLIARKAKEQNNQQAMLLNTRKAARLEESNKKYQELHSRMSILYKILSKMYTNSEILLEDTKDQVKVKEQEYKAIRASHSAMRSAMSIIKGDADKKAIFDMALEAIADDVANKVGEMERFMDVSANFMSSIDLQNGVFEEKGLQMLEEYERQSTLLLLGGKEISNDEVLDLKVPDSQLKSGSSSSNTYEGLFD
jgi:phage shock protein A